jgi:hypothetical protein
VSNLASTFNCPKRLVARSINPCPATASASDFNWKLVSTLRWSSFASIERSTCGAVIAARGLVAFGAWLRPARTCATPLAGVSAYNAGWALPRTRNVPLFAASVRSASDFPPRIATALPCHAFHDPLPETVASSGCFNPPIVAATPPAGAISLASTSSLSWSGTASSFSVRRSPPAIPGPVSASALAVSCARASAMCTPLSKRTICTCPVTALAMTKRSTVSLPISISRSGRYGAFGSVGTAVSNGERCQVISFAAADRTSTWLLRNAKGRQSTSSRGEVRNTPLGSATRTSVSTILP